MGPCKLLMPGPDLLAFSLLQHLAPPGLLMKQLQSSHLERTPPFTTPMNQSQNGFENHCSIQMDRQPGVIVRPGLESASLDSNPFSSLVTSGCNLE